MEKIYGYKEKDVLGLLEFIKNKNAGTLSEAFTEYAELNGKAKGTVRNLYYALAKKAENDADFCQKYLNGQKISVSKIVEFTKNEEEELIKSILEQKLKGKSVRKAIIELANGDDKRALRYQNKYRNFIKNNPALIEKYSVELSSRPLALTEKQQKDMLFQAQIKKLKVEINGLVEKISLSLKKENDKLRAKNAFLERENLNLRQELGLNDSQNKALRYFIKRDGNRVFS